ncbi:WRB/Get1 family [Zopfochytrium polystomum]|nr:WRB/Get1 family [Zopfochytrium polystomum]
MSNGSFDAASTPLLTFFVYAFILEIITKVRPDVIAATAYSAMRQLFPSEQSKKLVQMRKECIAVKTELTNTSAMDEFSKWAKLKRRLDKALQDLERLSKEDHNDKSKFQFRFAWGIRAILWLLQGTFLMLFGHTPMFFVPTAWTGPFAYILCLPFAPFGSVSASLWLMSCRNVIGKLSTALAGF